jgi:hypothetical protein
MAGGWFFILAGIVSIASGFIDLFYTLVTLGSIYQPGSISGNPTPLNPTPNPPSLYPNGFNPSNPTPGPPVFSNTTMTSALANQATVRMFTTDIALILVGISLIMIGASSYTAGSTFGARRK